MERHSRWLCDAGSWWQAAAGSSDVAIAKQLSVNRHTVKLWRKRFAEEGLDGLLGYCTGPGTEAPL